MHRAALPRPGLSRRGFLAASAAGAALLAAGCTSSEEPGEAVTAAQADALAAQVSVQEALVAAYAAAAAADPVLGAEVTELAAQAGTQLERLRAAAPGAPPETAPGAAPAPAVGPDARGWLREQVSAAAGSHASACTAQSGGRAALLGSVAAGLSGHLVVLA